MRGDRHTDMMIHERDRTDPGPPCSSSTRSSRAPSSFLIENLLRSTDLRTSRPSRADAVDPAVEQRAGLSVEQRAGLSVEQIAGLSAEQRAGLSVEQIAGLSAEQRAGLSAEQRAGLSPEVPGHCGTSRGEAEDAQNGWSSECPVLLCYRSIVMWNKWRFIFIFIYSRLEDDVD